MGRIVELRWTCADCDRSGILGRHKECPSCGSPREKGEMAMDGLDDRDAQGDHPGATVTDPELLELADAGPDWFCTFCESGNRGDVDICESCHAPRRDEAPSPFVPWESESRPESVRHQPWGWVVIGLAVLAMGVQTVLVFQPSPRRVVESPPPRVIQGQVTAVSWSHTVERQRWSDVAVTRWRSESDESPAIAPVDGLGGEAGLALVGNCREEVKDHVQRPCGTREECRPRYRTETVRDTCTRQERYACGETCTDNGNGFATCHTRYCSRTETYSCTDTRRVRDGEDCETVTRYCQEPVYDSRCDYQTQEWRRVDAEGASGHGIGTSWPTVEAGPGERLVYQADYDVTITYRDGDDTREWVAERSAVPDFVGTDRVAAQAAGTRLGAWSPGTDVWLRVEDRDRVTRVSLRPLPPAD